MLKIRIFLDKVISCLCASILALMSILVTWQVFTRYVLNKPNTFSEQLAQYLFVWLVFIGAALVFGKKGHMSIVFFVDILPKPVRLVLDIISEILIVAFSLLVLIYGGKNGVAMTMGQIDSTLLIPIGYIYAVIPISGIITVIYGILNVSSTIKKFSSKEGELA